jgi:hypothetical protein
MITLLSMSLAGLLGCNNGKQPDPCEALTEACVIDENGTPFSTQLGCTDDFNLLASEPLDASIPGARSAKTVVDRRDGNALYFQNSQDYPIHYAFCSEHLSGDGLPLVSDLATFNSTEYYSPDRRFILGAVTWYEEPGVWVYEVSPYDTASADLIAIAYDQIQSNSWFGCDLFFHPTSEAVETQVSSLPEHVKVITTEELFAGITYQPLNLGTSMGQLSFYSDQDLETAIPFFREIVVLDAVPNDISVVMGIITDAFQTPLSHINVLSQNRGTPNMASIGAFNNETLRTLEGEWVALTVGAMDWSIRKVTQAEADTWWEENKPEPIEVGPMDLSITALTDEWDILNPETTDLATALQEAIPAFGGKASHYGALALIGPDVPHPTAFAIPVYHYNTFMTDNGLWPVVDEMLADPNFQGDAATRRDMLASLRKQIEDGMVDADLVAEVEAKIVVGYQSGLYPQTRFRFRSSTNAEDTSGFNGAGLYASKSGDPEDSSDPVDMAMKQVWASVWSTRAYEERAYFSIAHTNIGMALLCHRSFPDEKANGVAITANIYDTAGIEPAFYINVQEGEESVVFPENGVTTDQIIYYHDLPGQPAVYIQHSNLIGEDETVLTVRELYELGTALSAVHDTFYGVYGTEGGFYGMDTEFKFADNPQTGEVQLFLKQARPYPGWEQ